MIAANHWSYGCKYNILKGKGPSELIPIRALEAKAKPLKANSTMDWPLLLFFAFNTDHAKTISNAKRSKDIFFLFHSFLLYFLLEHLGIILVFNG